MTSHADKFEELAVVLLAMSHAARLAILQLLAKKEMSVIAIQEQLRIPQATVSYHLDWLCRGGLVRRRRDGKGMAYSIADLTEHCLGKQSKAAAPGSSASLTSKNLWRRSKATWECCCARAVSWSLMTWSNSVSSFWASMLDEFNMVTTSGSAESVAPSVSDEIGPKAPDWVRMSSIARHSTRYVISLIGCHPSVVPGGTFFTRRWNSASTA